MAGKRSPASGKAKPTPTKAPRQKPAQDRRDKFIRQYLIHSNASRAYREAGYEDGPSVHQNASRLLCSDYVQSRLASAKAEALAKLDVKVAEVLSMQRDIAFTDRAEITSYEVGACRYCHGVDHAYQWRTPAEYQVALEDAIRESNRSGKPIIYPHSQDGGFGYSLNLPPHPDCPMCDGDGIPRIRFKDTRLMTEAERRVFAGVEQTQHGIKYRFEDRAKAIESLAQHLQFYAERDAANANAFAAAVAEVIARGSKMPLRKDAAQEGEA